LKDYQDVDNFSDTVNSWKYKESNYKGNWHMVTQGRTSDKGTRRF